jgi:S-formylglutathione hydrolase FrmB
VSRPSRRAVLAAGALAGLGVAAGVGAWWEWGRQDDLGRVRRFHSAARGRTVEVVAVWPSGADPARLPVCLALHGRGSRARDMVRMGLLETLDAVVRAGTPPFAVVAVDGNRDSYWIARTSGDDPQAMLRGELPGWLPAFGLPAAAPRAAWGISMGSFGALVCARGSRLAAVAAMSPALFTSWGDAAARHAFRDEQAWAANEPLRHLDALPPRLRLGVWCGAQDPFVPAARELARRGHARVASFGPGGHDEQYWRDALPAVVRFVGGQLAAAW